MYKYAVVDDVGKCYEVCITTNCTCDQYHVPVQDTSLKYLSKYYYPIPQYVDGELDFIGNWYTDFDHDVLIDKLEEVAR